jgi:maltooligosyltrehalose trehalohydrolase
VAASTPFLYFTDHAEALGRAVSRGQREEFRAFAAFADEETRTRISDLQAERRRSVAPSSTGPSDSASRIAARSLTIGACWSYGEPTRRRP